MKVNLVGAKQNSKDRIIPGSQGHFENAALDIDETTAFDSFNI